MWPEWTEWDASIIEDTHGEVEKYRDLYEGNHIEHFPRASRLIEKGDIINSLLNNNHVRSKNVTTPYIIANVCKLIPEIPARFVSRSIGNITSSIPTEQEDNGDTDLIEGSEGGHDINDEVIDLQQELIEQIEKNSNLALEHWTNILQHQIDGAVVGVVWNDDQGLRIEFKQRDVYYPHDDNLGVDLAYYKKINKGHYLHVYRERVENDGLRCSHFLYSMPNEEGGTLTPIEDIDTLELLGIDELEVFYRDRKRPFIIYWPNGKTFRSPLGTSCLKGQESKQDEVNWTITRNAQTFERNGKPRISVSTQVMNSLKEMALERYGDENKIDHRWLEVTEQDEKGNSLQIHQLDISKIGDMAWVKEIVKLMLQETSTSEKAVDFYQGENYSNSQSGVAKFYDLVVSITKSEQLRDEYCYIISQLFESCLWLASLENSDIIVEEPNITQKDMIPITTKELVEENSAAKEAGIRSVEKAVRNINPNASEDFIQEELKRIEEEAYSTDTNSMVRGRSNLLNMLDNPGSRQSEQITEEEVEDNE